VFSFAPGSLRRQPFTLPEAIRQLRFNPSDRLTRFVADASLELLMPVFATER
jgi:hypothetical protein